MYRKEQAIGKARAGERSGRGVPYTFLQIGRAYDELGNPDCAMHAYKEALRRDSTFALAHSDLGELYQDRGEIDTALFHARRALRYDSTRALYHYTIGEILVQANRNKEAIPHLRVAVSRLPWHYGSHYNLGKAFVRTGQEEEGRQYFRQADTLQALRSEIDQARAEAIGSNDADRWVEWGDLLRRSGRYAKAVETYRIAFVLDPEHRGARSKLGATRRQMRKGVG
jgi:tetratricopeptide (TPR) repeat protein